MNTNIYLASYGDFDNYQLLKIICNYFTKNINHDDITVFAALGGKNGDIICRNYIIKNNLKHEFLKPSQLDKPNILQKCNHAIVFNNGKSKGINISLKLLPRYISGKIVEVHTNINEMSIYQFEKDIINKHYSIKNGKLNLT